MKGKRERACWGERTERFADGVAARSRVGHLRSQPNVSHVTIEKDGAEYAVSFSVAKWYVAEMQKAGVKL